MSNLTSEVAAIVAGDEHTCALTTSGGMKCWGKNASGQLGNNSTTDSSTPVDVSTLTSGVASIAAGDNQTCAVTTGGAAKCWGSNSYGQVGDGTTTLRKTPVSVSGLTSGVATIDGGDEHTCARTTGGGAKCWGRNNYGQLGDGTTTDHLTPVNVSGLTSGVAAIATRQYHTCARTTGGGAKCWGDDYYGQLGDGFNYYSTTPVSILLGAGTSYTYDTTHKHAVTALGTGESYSYDANGNMTTRVEGGLTYTQTFNAENRLISVAVSGQTTQFIYDGDGNLIKKIKPDGSKTLYIGGIYEVDKTSGGTVTGTRTYYPAAGAMRIGSTLYYVLKDHLGSASAVTDTSGTIVGEQRYYPFGETRFTTGTMYTDKLFTGQRAMAGLGIYNYGARFYSPYINRFLSADTIVPGYANSQNLNRYSYTLNNPVRYTDPTGHWVDNGCSTGCSTTSLNTYCATHPASCSGGGGGGSGGGGNGSGGGNGGPHNDDNDSGLPTTTTDPTLTPTLNPTPAEEGTNNYYCLTYSFSCGMGAASLSIPFLPPSPFACQWVDCALSAASLIFSGLTMTEIPQIAVPAFIADVVVTGVALVHTYDDYQQGEIGVPTALALGITGFVGLAPGPVGFGFSAINTIVTVFGFPYP